MNKITTVKTIMLVLLFVLAQGLFAQNKNDEKPKEKFRLRLVENENGKEKVIDKTFSSREELEAYMKETHKEMPEIEEIEGVPDVPEVPPVPPVPPGSGQMCNKDKHCTKECKKIVIVENEKGEGKNTAVKIITDELSPKERAEVEKEIESAIGGEVKVIIIKKEGDGAKMKMRETKEEAPQAIEKETNDQPGPAGIEETGLNISNLKLFPNPNSGQFHVEFKMGKPSDVKIRITDINGKEVYSETLKNFSGQFTKDIQRGQGAGTYILDVEAGGEKQSARVVVQ